MFNATRNSVFLFYLFMLILALGIVYLILDLITTYTASQITATGLDNPVSTQMYINYLNTRSMLITSFYIIVSFAAALSWVSSFVDRTNLMSYLFNMLALLIITPLVIYLASSFWSQVQIVGITLDTVRLEFVSNWSWIITINFFLGLLSFLFVPKGQGQSA